MAAYLSKSKAALITLDFLFKAYCEMDPVSFERKLEHLPLTQADNWLRRAHILDDEKITQTDTGLCFFKFRKRALTYDEFHLFLQDLAQTKKLDYDEIQRQLLSCSVPSLQKERDRKKREQEEKKRKLMEKNK